MSTLDSLTDVLPKTVAKYRKSQNFSFSQTFTLIDINHVLWYLILKHI